MNGKYSIEDNELTNISDDSNLKKSQKLGHSSITSLHSIDSSVIGKRNVCVATNGNHNISSVAKENVSGIEGSGEMQLTSDNSNSESKTVVEGNENLSEEVNAISSIDGPNSATAARLENTDNLEVASEKTIESSESISDTPREKIKPDLEDAPMEPDIGESDIFVIEHSKPSKNNVCLKEAPLEKSTTDIDDQENMEMECTEDAPLAKSKQSNFSSPELVRSVDSDAMMSPPCMETSTSLKKASQDRCNQMQTSPQDIEITIEGDACDRSDTPVRLEIRNTLDDMLGKTVAEVDGNPMTSVCTKRASPHVSPTHSEEEDGDTHSSGSPAQVSNEERRYSAKRPRLASPSDGDDRGRLKKVSVSKTDALVRYPYKSILTLT